MLDPKCFMWDHSRTLGKAEEFFSLNPEGRISVKIEKAGRTVARLSLSNVDELNHILDLIQQDYPNRLDQKSGLWEVRVPDPCICEPVSDRFIGDILIPALT